MGRDLTDSFKNEIDGDVLSPAIFIQFKFINGNVNVWTGYNEIVFNNEIYIGAGDILTIDPVTETQELRATGVSFGFSNLNSALTAVALSENYQGRPAIMWFAVLDNNRNIITTPYQLFKGRIDVITFNDNGNTSDFTIQCESNMIDLRKANERRYTDEEQKVRFEGDKGLEFMARIQDIEVNWG
jgi:hypothetical protein